MDVTDTSPFDFEIDHEPIRTCLINMGTNVADLSQATGIALPKLLIIFGMSNNTNIRLSGFEMVTLCAYTGIPISTVVVLKDHHE